VNDAIWETLKHTHIIEDKKEHYLKEDFFLTPPCNPREAKCRSEKYDHKIKDK
jgi:hypothetical protein